MVKTAAKKHRRLKKRIRQTLGTLFLVSAIVVAAIPVDSLQAAGGTTEEKEVTVELKDTKIPWIEKKDTIYSTGDGRFQFAYVDAKGTDGGTGGNKVAVIINYDNQGSLAENTLTIPDKVDVYGKFTYNQGTSQGYVAVGASGNFLYYRRDLPMTNSDGSPIMEEVGKDEEGKPILQQKTEPRFFPCYYNDRANWENLDLKEFYYKPDPSASDGDANSYRLTDEFAFQRIVNASVVYISNQYLDTITDENGQKKWVASEKAIDETTKGKAAFANRGNIVHLKVGENLSGIGNYAFWGCNAIESISLGNGLNTIGNYAFADCLNMKSLSIDVHCDLQEIGDHAFYNCNALKSFNVPISVKRIGDSAFENCLSMESIDLNGGGDFVALSKLGKQVFKGCMSLNSLSLPRNFSQELKVSVFEGCTSLKFISLPNASADLVEDGEQTYATFKKTVKDEFYLEGYDVSNIHETAKKNTFAFKYIDADIYEWIKRDENHSDDQTYEVVYQVNSSNQLISCIIGQNVTDVEIPRTIGPYQVTEINSGSFQNNCALKKIVIPSSIVLIAENAFRGCHHLTSVVFAEPINITSIGPNAFQTQDIENSVHVNCSNPTLDENPVLNFTGTISPECAPFVYAMDPDSNINKGTQKVTYINYFSGWPTNLEVRYNPENDMNELVDYPTLSELISYNSSSFPYITDDNWDAAHNAYHKFLETPGNSETGKPITQNEQEILNAVMDINLPQGIESVKDGLFANKEADESSLPLPQGKAIEKSITTDGIAEIPAEMFKDCTNLVSMHINGNTTSIGNYAFKNCNNLKNVTISSTVNTLGLRPFAGCGQLLNVDFQGGPYFTCQKSIIYGLGQDGSRQKIMECLESNGDGTVTDSENGKIAAADLAGVTEIAPEAFMDCKSISSVDFSSSAVKELPRSAFENTTGLYTATLPITCRAIGERAFYASGIREIDIPQSVTQIDNTAFIQDNAGTINSKLTFYCDDDSNAAIYADQKGINREAYRGETYYKVTFGMVDSTGALKDIKTDLVLRGQDAVPPTSEEYPELDKEGSTFTGWNPDYRDIVTDTYCMAQFKENDPNANKLTVEFYDINNELIKSELVDSGTDASTVAPKLAELEVEGKNFVGWRPAIDNITENTKTYAQYEPKPEGEYTIKFFDYNMTLLYTQSVKPGEEPYEPKDPVRAGYTFTGWLPKLGPVTKDTEVYAQYDKDTSDNNGGGNGDDNNGGGNGDDNNGGGNGDDNNGGGNDNNNNNNNNGNVKYYTLTVKNGSGSGSYVAGHQAIVIANDPAEGQEFSNWTIDPSDTKIASKAVTATVITIPEKDVTVTANYAAKNGTTTGSGNSSTNNSNNNNSNKDNGSSGSGGTISRPDKVTSNGTTVVIDKNGLSNTGVVNATVNGSSDNFTIKITESSDATEEVVKALMNEYGDLTNIKYFPMDITLYDSTGANKITDTTGLSIDITLPLPDSLIEYAGNNKAAGVVNERLDKLSPRFSTIDGVSCITFTAQHFSPYVIYADTSNLTAGTITDNTPKTGDGIHPKWFLAIGLACISMVLFMKKDRRTVKVRKAMA